MVWKSHLATNSRVLFEIHKNVLSDFYRVSIFKHHKNTHGTNAGRRMLGNNPALAPFVAGFFYPNSVATRKEFLRSQLRPDVQSRWSAVGPTFFLVNSTQNGSSEMSICASTAQARTKCASRSWSRFSSSVLSYVCSPMCSHLCALPCALTPVCVLS